MLSYSSDLLYYIWDFEIIKDFTDNEKHFSLSSNDNDNAVNNNKTAKSTLCRMCGTRNETISHIVSDCGKLAQKRHDSVGKYVHCQFCEKLGFNRARLWYEHKPESVAENENFKILWDFTTQYDHMIEARRSDIVVVDKVKKEIMITDVAIPEDTTVCDKE